MKTAYLTFTYPALSQTFVVDEVHGLREAGMEVETWALGPPAQVALGTDRNRDEAGRTRTLRPVDRVAMARAHGRALRASPAGYVRTLGRALADRPPGLRALALALAAFAAAVRMWDELDRRDVRHLHVHFAGSPTHVAMLLCAFGNAAPGDGPAWTWSATVHGPVEFEDSVGLRLQERVRDALFVVAISDFARSQLLKHAPERGLGQGPRRPLRRRHRELLRPARPRAGGRRPAAPVRGHPDRAQGPAGAAGRPGAPDPQRCGCAARPGRPGARAARAGAAGGRARA